MRRELYHMRTFSAGVPAASGLWFRKCHLIRPVVRTQSRETILGEVYSVLQFRRIITNGLEMRRGPRHHDPRLCVTLCGDLPRRLQRPSEILLLVGQMPKIHVPMLDRFPRTKVENNRQ